MASRIQELLHEIEIAIYGEQVRGAIHDAIEECYSDVSSAATLANAATASANELKGYVPKTRFDEVNEEKKMISWGRDSRPQVKEREDDEKMDGVTIRDSIGRGQDS